MRGWIVALALVACSHPEQTALQVAAAGASTTTLEIDRLTQRLREDRVADYRVRSAGCTVADDSCHERARVATERAMAPRVELARALIAAQNRVADALEAGGRCADDPCRAAQGALAATAGAEVATLLGQLRAVTP